MNRVPRLRTELSLLLLLSFLHLPTRTRAETDYASAITAFDAAVESEMREWSIQGVAVALTDGTRLIHARGFGEAERESVFRAGSISKLFNAIAVMQRVEAGQLDLDAALGSLPGGISPVHPFRDTPAASLRQALAHRSGLPREAPVGSYFDDSEPGLEATCASLREAVLATPPGAKSRYSNIAPSLAGLVVASVAGQSFEQYQAQNIFSALGLTHSAWRRREVPGGKVLRSHMRFADLDGQGGFHHGDAPLFDLGTIPAGNLFTTAPDLARLLGALAEAMQGRTNLLRPATWAEMWKPRYEDAAFGIGFGLGKFRGHRTVGHSGAVYGHSTLLTFLPETQLGVVILANEDIVNARVGRLGGLALSQLLHAKFGEVATDVAPEPTASPPSDADLRPFTGHYESQSYWTEVRLDGGRLVGNFATQPCRFSPRGDGKFALDSRIHDAAPVTFERGPDGRVTGFSVGPQKFMRVPEPADVLPVAWRRFCGVYGTETIPVVVHERLGHLYATTENMVDYRLTPVNRFVFALPPGMYVDEYVVFHCGADGLAHGIDFASVPMKRR